MRIHPGGAQPEVRLLLVKDHAVFRELFAFDLEAGFEFVAQVRSSLERGVDVAVVNLHLPDGNGAGMIDELREGNPESVVAV